MKSATPDRRLSAGQFAQAAHFESANEASNVRLHANCDRAQDPLGRMAITHALSRIYTDYDAMLVDPQWDAVPVATADKFHVPACLAALRAGEHVLCEKPIRTTFDEVDHSRDVVRASGRVLHVAHMKRFDPGIRSARDFVQNEMGEMIVLEGGTAIPPIGMS